MNKILENSTWMRVIMAAALVIIILVGLVPVMPVKVTPATAPKNEFSSERAMTDLKVVSAEPHPMGSSAQVKVREYLLAQIEEAGAKAEVQEQNDLANIIVTLPGSDPTGKILLSGHYDSAYHAPGAGDDGVSTVAMLEAIRVLQAGQSLRNDLVFVFFDGEEAGMWGSTAFLRTPLARQIDAVLAFEAWPGHGPTTFQQSSEGDEWVIWNLAQASPRVYAMSYSVKNERRDFDSDFDVLATMMMGMEFENNGDGMRYHQPEDTVDGVDPSLVQSQGEAMLTLARHFGSLDLSTAYAGNDLTFFTWPVIGIVAYPYWGNLLVSGIAILIIVVTVVLGWLRGRRIRPVPVLVSAVAFSVLFLGSVLVSKALWEKVIDAHPESVSYAFPVFEGSGWVLLGFMLVAWILFTILMSLLSRYTGVSSMAVGVIIAWVAFSFYLFGPAAFNLGNPFAVEFIAWSLLGAACSLAVVTFTTHPGRKLVFYTLAAIPVVFMFAPQVVFSILKPREGAMIPVLLVIMATAVMLPQVLLVVGRHDTIPPANS